jgi:hypothetical protein
MVLVTLMMETILSSEALAVIRATRRNIPEGDILHSYRRENLKSYKKRYLHGQYSKVPSAIQTHLAVLTFSLQV